jgi:hypothetical protein
MPVPNVPFDFSKKLTSRRIGFLDRSALDLLGGELLEGSGFEEEVPTPDFRFDWTPSKDQIEGGLQ